MKPLTKGKYTVRHAQGAAEQAQIAALRLLCFGAGAAEPDPFDAVSEQIIVCAHDTQTVVAAFRILVLPCARLDESYSAQFYDLSVLQAQDGPLLELGRFCIAPDQSDPDILRIAWAALTAHVDATGIQTMIGCSSFSGTKVQPYADAFALLKARHLAPAQLMPGVKARDVYHYAAQLDHKVDLARAHARMPPLLRSYLLMGGWVSDHAVIDRAMGTLHVFTALQVSAVPLARKKRLRALV